jgi:hypothetical protein
MAVLAAKAAVEDTAYVQDYVAEVLAARELLCVGLEKLAIPYVPARRISFWRNSARAIEVRDALRGAGHPGPRPQLRSPRLRPLHRRHARADPPPAAGANHEWRWTQRDLAAMSQPILIFDMDGVLVDVTESYRETIAATVEHFTGRRPTNEKSSSSRTRAASMTIGSSRTTSSPESGSTSRSKK